MTDRSKSENKPRPIPRKRKAPARPSSRRVGGGKRPWSHVHCLRFLFGIGLLLNIFIVIVLYLFVLLDIPDISSLASYRPKQATRVFDREGTEIFRVYDENRLVVALKDLPVQLPQAFIAAEDARFYQHAGVDLWSIARALLHNIRSSRSAHGGSTITQQVTRSLLLSRKKLYSRKIKEAILAYRIDSTLNKDEIMHIYLNQIYLGDNAYGVEAAALGYFGKSAGKLSLGEIALLAGLPQAPSRYSPTRNMDLARNRQAYVLNRMAAEGFISAEEARQAFAAPVVLTAPIDPVGESGFFSQQVLNLLEKQYGNAVVRTGGLLVYTTMDRKLQEGAVDAVRTGTGQLAADGNGALPQAALVAIENNSGRVRALAGGIDFRQSQFNRATQARRRPGSAIKPLVYAAALEQGLTMESLVDDAPLSLPGASLGSTWQPHNFDNQYEGMISLYHALVHSKNTATIRLLQQVGITPTISLAARMGITSPLGRDLSLALGSSEVTLLELTGAYTVFANGGRFLVPHFIDTVKSRDGRVLFRAAEVGKDVLKPQTARQVDLMLQGVISEGTGSLARGLPGRSAGKTGTTDNNVDAWFIGYNDRLTAGVWVGHDRQISLGVGATGGRVAAPIWRDFMGQAAVLR